MKRSKIARIDPELDEMIRYYQKVKLNQYGQLISYRESSKENAEYLKEAYRRMGFR